MIANILANDKIIACLYANKYISIGDFLENSNVRTVAFDAKILTNEKIYNAIIFDEQLMLNFAASNIFCNENNSLLNEKSAKIIFALWKICEKKYSPEKLFVLMYEDHIQDYIIKQIKIMPNTDIENLLECVVNELYTAYCSLLIDDYYPTYIEKFTAKNITGQYFACLVFRRIGKNICSNIFSDVSTAKNISTNTIIFAIINKLLILHQTYFLHGNLTCENFVMSTHANKSIPLIYECDIINFGSAISFNEDEKILAFVKKSVPKIFANHEKLITTLANISPNDIAVAASSLDLLPILNACKDEFAKKISHSIQHDFEKYLLGDQNISMQKYQGGGMSNDSLALLAHKSIFSASDYDIFGGSENAKKSHNIEMKHLPLYKILCQYFH
jgi:hypothetical protein